MHRFVLCLAILAGASSLYAADRCVDARNQTGTEDGSPLRPYTTVTAAVAAADGGDRILVAGGTYAGPIRVQDKALALFGGYGGNTTELYAAAEAGNFSNPSPAEFPTTLLGAAGNATLLLINAGATRVEGFTITGGRGAHEDAFRTQGGGIFIDGGAPIIDSNIIEANDSRNDEQESFGGGIFTTNADTTIVANIIRNNQSGRGAGIAVSGGAVRIVNNTISGNIGNGDHGGGIYAFSPDLLIEGNEIFDNEIGREIGYGWGGGIIVFNPGASAVLRNNRVHHNYSPGRGSGVFIDEGATALMENCLIYKNETNPDAGAGGVYVDYGPDNIPSTLTMRFCTVYGHSTPEPTLGGNGLFIDEFCSAVVENCIFWGNDGFTFWAPGEDALTVTYTTAENAQAGTGNLTGDPQFASPIVDDFHLQSTKGRWSPESWDWVYDLVDSPCIDAADPAAPFDQEVAGNGGRANQGAYGNTPQASRTSRPAPSGWVLE